MVALELLRLVGLLEKRDLRIVFEPVILRPFVVSTGKEDSDIGGHASGVPWRGPIPRRLPA